MNKKLLILLKILPFAVIAILAATILLSGQTITLDTVLSYTPESKPLASLFLLFMFAARSLSVVFPIVLLYVASGTIFSPVYACILNVIGTMIGITIPYFVGYFCGEGFSERLMEKYPFIKRMRESNRRNDFFLCFFLRIISFLPGDLVCLYLGQQKITFWKYFTASMLGFLPGIILVTLLGVNITNPTSPEFLLTAALTIIMSAASLGIYLVVKRVKSKRNA